MLDKTKILKYRNKITNEYAYSFIIEDEQEKENILIQSIIKREQGIYLFHSYEEIPNFLKPYVNTENFTIKDQSYYFNPLVYDDTSFHNIIMSAVQFNYKKIKKLENEIALIKEKLGI